MGLILLIIAAAFGLYVYENFSGGSLSSLVTGGNLDASTIAQYAANAGFAGDDLVTAVAIALAESAGNPSAYNPGTSEVPETSYGLWQVNTLANPQYAGMNLLDPQTNADVAYEIYSSSGFTPWSTFTSGAYQDFLTTAQVGVQSVTTEEAA